MKPVELNFGHLIHTFSDLRFPSALHLLILQMSEEQQSTGRFWSLSAFGKKRFLRLVLLQRRIRNLLQEGKRAMSECAGWVASFMILAALLLAAVVGRLLCSLHFPFQQLCLCRRAGSDVGAEGTPCTPVKWVKDWAPSMPLHPEKWRYWWSLFAFTNYLEEEVSWIVKTGSLLVKKSDKQLWSIYFAAGHLRGGLQ